MRLTTEQVRRDYREYDLAGGTLEEQDEERARNDARFDRWLAGVKAEAEAWQAGVDTALNHALRNPDGVTLRLEHLDGRPWKNPYKEEA